MGTSNKLPFKQWVEAERAYEIGEKDLGLEELRNSTIGIDAEDYLVEFLNSRKEPLLPALGGQPFSLTAHVDENLKHFEDAGIEPIFVFNGLDHACKDRRTILAEGAKASETLDTAWRIYDAGRADDAVAAFGMACTYHIDPIVRGLRAYLHSKGISCVVAPYSAAAQLVQLEADSVIQGILGSASCLVHGADVIIIDFDWTNKNFKHTNLALCADTLGVSKPAFVDLCLLCGYSILPTMPELDIDSNTPKLHMAKGLLQRAGYDAYAYTATSREPGYQMRYHEARYAVKFATTFQIAKQEVVQANPELLPSDAHDFVSQRLTNEMYWYLIRGLIGPRILAWRTRMEVLEIPPLDGGMSQAYRELVNTKLVPLRAEALVVITYLQNRYFQKHDVELSCWFDNESKKMLAIPDNLASATKADYWNVTQKELPTMALSPSGSLRYAIRALAKEADAKKTIKYHKPNDLWMLNHVPELRPNIIWRFLQTRGYIKDDHNLSSWGKALYTAFEKADGNQAFADPAVAPEIEEAIVLAFELVRLGSLNTMNMFQSPPYSGQPLRGTEKDRSNVLLISRIACLATLQHKAIGYTGPLSRHLLAYHQIAAAVRGALRDLVEAHACNLYLTGSVNRQLTRPNNGKTSKPIVYTDLAFQLPYVHEPDAGLGLLVKSYLDELSNEAPRQSPRASISEWFVHAQDIDGDLKKVWRLFETINAGLQAADSAIVPAETKKMFSTAAEWLAEKLAKEEASLEGNS